MYTISVDIPRDREWHYPCADVEQLRVVYSAFEQLKLEIIDVLEGERSLTTGELAALLEVPEKAEKLSLRGVQADTRGVK